MNNSITVVFGFDMETDIGSWTPFYKGVQKGTPRILKILEQKGVEATFFFTGDAARKFPDVVKMVDRAGHDVGSHSLYHETIGDPLFEIPGIKPLLPEEVKFRLKVSTQWVQDSLGKKVVSFRAPRLWSSTAAVNALEDLGYRADASYPLFFYEKRLVPYYPSRRDWRKEGRMKILEIPNFCDMSIKPKDPYKRDRDQWPVYRIKGAGAMMKHVENFANYVRRRKLPVVLCFYFHPWEFVELPQGAIHFGEGSVIPDNFIVKNCGRVMVREFKKIVDALEKMGAEFMSARTLARKWKTMKKK